MRKVFAAIFVISMIILTSCKPDANTPGSLKLKVNPRFGANALSLNTIYTAPDGKYYRFTTFKFVMSHIKLVKNDGSSVEVKPVAYVGVDRPSTFDISLPDSIGSFKGIAFNIGLDSIQDNSPVSTDSSSPYYNDNLTWWGPSQLFVFVQLDGYGDAVANPSNTLGYHLGTSTYYTPVYVNKNFSNTGNSQTVLNMDVDLQKVFYGTNAVNVPSESQSMTTDHPAVAQKFMSNFVQAFSIQ